MNARRSVCGPTGLPVQPPPVGSNEDRSLGPFADGQVDRPGGARHQRDGDDLAALASDGQRPGQFASIWRTW